MTGPDAESAGWRRSGPRGSSPYIWHENARRSRLEAAERCFTEGFEQGRRERLAQSIVLRLFYRRGIDAPESVRRKVRASRDPDEQERRRSPAYEVRGPEALFCAEG
ncbi:hypothetical protein WJ438_17595 [Streptomyces sp. GD-15H]|uniref:hypothetical protein n=1 Tax=Streptomyces sp. GD-15H TaxID=3129112 RepID=UPI0032516A73